MNDHICILMSILLQIFNHFKIIVIWDRKPHNLTERQVTENNIVYSQCCTKLSFGLRFAVLTKVLMKT
jgi:hypothetical protein